MEIVLNLPENVYKNFVAVAKKKSRQVNKIIAEKIQSDYWLENFEEEIDLSKISDAEVLEIANLKFSKSQERRFGQLLEKQRESQISAIEKLEIDGLIALNDVANLRKAKGCLEALKRGLIKTQQDLKWVEFPLNSKPKSAVISKTVVVIACFRKKFSRTFWKLNIFSQSVKAEVMTSQTFAFSAEVAMVIKATKSTG